MRADLKYAWRLLSRSPGFTATAVTALALGIGANTAIFSVVNAVLLQPLPYPQTDRMVQLRGSTPGGDYNPTSIPRFMAYRALTGTLQDVTAYDWNGGSGVNLGSGDRAEQVSGEHVSLAYFRLFGARMEVGRPFLQEEDRPGGGRAVVLSGGLWQRRFGADPNIVGQSILLGGDPYTVVGVASSAFAPDPPADLWMPLQADQNTTNHSFYIYCAGRLRPGVTLQQAQAALRVAAVEFARKYPGAKGPNTTFTAQPLRDNVTGEVRPALLVLLTAVACVLLIACANVASLLLARAMGRGRELAIRAALGATRGRIATQLLVESLLLAALGGALGLLFGAVGVRALLAVNPGNVPRIAGAALLDARVLGFTLLVTLLTGVLFGLAPALQVSRTDLITTIKRRHHRARAVMVVAEVALALVLLTGSGLLLRTFYARRRLPPGFDGANVLTLETSLHGSRFEKATAATDMIRRTEERIRAIPGVQAVAVAPSASAWRSTSMGVRLVPTCTMAVPRGGA